MSLRLEPTVARTRAAGRGLAANARGVSTGLDAVARGLGEAGRATEAVVRAKQKRQDERDRIWRATTLAEGGARWAETEAERERDAGLGAPGHAAGLTADFDAWQEETLASAPASQKEALKLDLIRLRSRLTLKADEFETASRTAAQTIELKGAGDALGRGVYAGSTGLDEGLAQVDALLNDLDAPAATVAKLGAELRGSLTSSYFEGLIEQDPFAAEAELLKGRPDLDSKVQAQLVRSAKVEQRRIEDERSFPAMDGWGTVHESNKSLTG